MQRSGSQCQGVTRLHQKSHDFARKGGKGGEPSQKSSNDCQPPQRVKLGHGLKYRDANPHQVAANQIGCQRSPREQTARREPQA